MFIFKRGNSLKNVQNSTKKKPKNMGVLRTVKKITKQETVIADDLVKDEPIVPSKKNSRKADKNKEEENI